MIAVVPLAVALVLGVDAGYVRTKISKTDPISHCLLWVDPEITFVQDTLGSADTLNGSELTAFSQSLATWDQAASVCSSIRVNEGARVTERMIGWDEDSPTNRNAVLYRRTDCNVVVPNNHACWSAGSCQNEFDCWDGRDGTIALTTTTYNQDTGHIYDVDIEANDLWFFFTTVDAPPCSGQKNDPTCVATDVQNTMTHELGHALGLDHAAESWSTMYSNADQGETSKRQLDLDTRQYLCDAYPASGIPRDCVALRAPRRLGTADTTLGLGCSSAPVGAAIGLLAVVAIGVGRQRRDRTRR